MSPHYKVLVFYLIFVDIYITIQKIGVNTIFLQWEMNTFIQQTH